MKSSIKEDVAPPAKDSRLQTILLSSWEKPLDGWSKYLKNGYVKRVTDEETQGRVIELSGNPDHVYIMTPDNLDGNLGIRKRWFCLVFKQVKPEPMKFQVQCLDSTGVKRVFRFDSRIVNPKLLYLFADLPFTCKPGWNNTDVDLRVLMRKCYGTDLTEVNRIHIHANCRLRRVFFSEVYFGDESLPGDYRLISTPHKHGKSQEGKETEVEA